MLTTQKEFIKKLKMIGVVEQDQESFRSRFFNFRGTQENAGRHAKSLSVESASVMDSIADDDGSSRSQGSTPVHVSSAEKQQAGLPLSPAPSNRHWAQLQDVGHAVLESYSRILESLAFTVMSRIEDVLHADGLTQDPIQTAPRKKPTTIETPPEKSPDKREVEANNYNYNVGEGSMTLLDFMGWGQEQSEAEAKRGSDALLADSDVKQANRAGNVAVTNSEGVSNMENLNAVISPSSRD